MNPKCPWCGKPIETGYYDGWYFSCSDKECPSLQKFGSEQETIAAASKRFMPKRSVGEIMRGTNKFRDMYADQFNKCVRHESGKVPCEYDDYLEAVMYTRIADYIYGVTE